MDTKRYAPGEACRVCGHAIANKDLAYRITCDSVEYLVCTSACVAAFKSDPDRYTTRDRA